MLRLAAIAFILAIVAGLFGFGFFAVAFAEVARLFFWGFVIVFVIGAVLGLVQGRRMS